MPEIGQESDNAKSTPGNKTKSIHQPIALNLAASSLLLYIIKNEIVLFI